MVDISTLAGITRTDHVYEVTSEIDLAAEYDDIEDSFIVIKDGGALRHQDGCVLTYRNCLIIEEPDADSPGANNYQGANSRYANGCNVQYINCDYIIANDDGNEQRGFDITSGASVRLENFRCLIEEGEPRSFNHLNSADIIIINATFDNKSQIADGRRGVPFEQNVNYDTAPDRLTIIDPRDDTTPNRLWVVLLGQITNANITVSKLKIIKSDGTLNDNLQVLGLWQGDRTDLVTLIDPFADLAKVTGSGQADGNRGNLVVRRSYKGKVIDLAGDDLSAKINIQRLGWVDQGTTVESYEGDVVFGSNFITLAIDGISDTRTVLTVGDPITFANTPHLNQNTVYFLRPTPTANRYELATTREGALSGSTLFNFSSESGVYDFTVNLNEQVEEIDGDEWDTTLEQYRSASHQTNNINRNRYTRSVSKYGYQPDRKTFTLEWAETLEDGLDDGSITLREDQAITEETESTVEAYTQFTITDGTDTEALAVEITADATFEELVDYLQWYAANNPELVYIRRKDFSLVSKDGDVADIDDIDITVNDNVTFSKTDKYSSIKTSGDITINGEINGSYEDSSGKLVQFKTSPAGALIRIVPSSGTTRTATTDTTTGLYSAVFPTDASLKIYTKADYYEFRRNTIDVDDIIGTYQVDLIKKTHIDESEDISAFTIADATIADTTDPIEATDDEVSDRIFFDFADNPSSSTTPTKASFICGLMDTRAQFRKMEKLLDKTITTQEGLRFYEYFIEREHDAMMEYLGDKPYHADSDQIAIREDYLQFIRFDGMTSEQHTRLGMYMLQKDEMTEYRAPHSNHDRVEFDAKATQNVLPASTATEVVETVTNDETYMNALAQAINDLPASDVDTEDSIGKLLKDKLNTIDTNTENLNYNDDGDVLASLDGEITNTSFEHLYICDDQADKTYVYDIDGARIKSLEFNLHHNHDHVKGIDEINGLFYVLDSPSGSTRHVYVYNTNGARLSDKEFDLHSSNASPQDIRIHDGKVYILDDTANSEKLFVYDLETHDRLTGSELDLNGVENVLGFDIYNGKIYVTDARTDPNHTKVLRVFRLSDGAGLTAENFNLNSGQSLPTGVILTDSRVIIVDKQTNSKIFVYTHNGMYQADESFNLTGVNVSPTGLAILKSSPHRLNELITNMDEVKTKTDKLQFNADNDVKSTLDTEEVDIGKIRGTAVTDIDDFKTSATDIAIAIENGLLNEDDGRQLLQSIYNKIVEALEDEDITTGMIATAVWAKSTDGTTSGTFEDMIKNSKDVLDLLEKFDKADIEIDDTYVKFIYNDTELVKFQRRTSTTNSNWSGGRDRVTE